MLRGSVNSLILTVGLVLWYQGYVFFGTSITVVATVLSVRTLIQIHQSYK